MARTGPRARKAMKEDARKLRRVRHAYAPKIAKLARIILMAAKRLRKLEADMAKEASSIAGQDYRQRHTISFDGHGSIEDQLENLGTVESGPGIKDIEVKAKSIAEEAQAVADRVEPPSLPSEDTDDDE